MNTLADLGGVRVFGIEAAKWSDAASRFIGTTPAVFDSDVPWPDISFGKNPHFELPCHRGECDYEIHLLESGDAIIIKNGKMFQCTHRNGKPRVLTFLPVPADREDAQQR
jgi:hypothetical protein